MRKNYVTFIISGLYLLIFFKGGDPLSAGGSSEKVNKSSRRNALSESLSPYLQQHADNPVNWMEWSDEAFALAKKQDKPIFLSIGYSTCHWCHVMAHESFSDPDIAEIMNRHFINIKVDREVRPDVDAIYMRAVQVMSGNAGWPLSVFLAPDGKPFYGGTYFPPTSRYGMPSFETVLKSIAGAWENERDKLLNSADRLTEIISADREHNPDIKLTPGMLTTAAKRLTYMFDPAFGGFGRAPKFPQPSNLSMLLAYYHRTRDKDAIYMVKTTLDNMADGGIYDHLGGGFHRYSTDSMWLVPHFEKMLYDQALITRALIETYQVTGDQKYADTACEVFDYVLRDMLDQNGGFYSAEDADSEGHEGTFYVWSKNEIVELLGDEDAEIFNSYYGVTDEGNFEGKNILHVVDNKKEIAKKYSVSEQQLTRALSRGRKTLFDAREKRIRPHRDEKIITGWNGLMVASFARAGRVLNNNNYTNAASNAMEFILKELIVDGRLKRYFASGKAEQSAVLDDYAFVIYALVELYHADYNPKWLSEAIKMSEAMIELFADKEKGGFFLTGVDSEKLIYRGKDITDGAIPSGNSVAAAALLKLGRLTAKSRFVKIAEKAVEVNSSRLAEGSGDLYEMLVAVDFLLGPKQEIVISAGNDKSKADAMLDVVNSYYLPRAVVVLNDASNEIQEIVPFVKNQPVVDGKATAYVCQNYACKQPVTDIKKLGELINEICGRDTNAESRDVTE